MYDVSTTDVRLKRLVMSEICRGESAEKYAVELKSLARKLGDDHHFRSKERFFKALGDSIRLRMIKLLAEREMCVCEIMVALDLTQSNASHHLNILEHEGVAEKRREGKWILYRLSTPKIVGLIEKVPL